MLARKYRLDKKRFDVVKKEGKVVKTNCLTLLYLKNPDNKEHSFVGFVVSSIVAKNASLRNRAARSMNEGMRYNFHNLKPGYDILFIGRPEIAKTYTSEVMAQVREVLEKAKLLS